MVSTVSFFMCNIEQDQRSTAGLSLTQFQSIAQALQTPAAAVRSSTKITLASTTTTTTTTLPLDR